MKTNEQTLRARLREIRLIALDMDGTCLNSQGICSPYTRQVLQKLLDRG